jgi:hypothetical protein
MAAKNGTRAFHVWMIVDRDLFRYDWNSCVSDRWTDPKGIVVSGLIRGIKPGERLPDLPR